MALFTDDFSGPDNTLLTGRTGWSASTGYNNTLYLDGAGGVKDNGLDDGLAALNQTSAADHYVEAVVGAGFAAQAQDLWLTVCMSGRSAWLGITYDAGSSVLRVWSNRGGVGGALSSVQTLTGQTVSAGDTLRLEWDATDRRLIAKKNGSEIYNAVLTSESSGLTGTNTGIVTGFNTRTARTDYFRSWESNQLGGGDVTAPTLTSATATATGANTATGGVTTDEAGPAWAVLTTSSTTPSAAQIKAGQNHTGATASASATATLAVGANSSVFSFTGLTGGQTYWLHVVQDDTASPANTSTPITSASSITTPTPDTTPPTMNGSITVGTKTSGSISISYPAASDNVAVTGYEVSTNGSTWSDNSTSLSYTFLGLSALTSYTLYVRAYDAAGNRAATPLTVTTSTYRAGDTAANILANTGPVGGNPAGFLHAFASTVSGTDWLSYTITSGPTPSGGTLDAQPDGRFTYTGPAPATMVIQPEVNGANAAETITVTLYDQTGEVPDTDPPVLSAATAYASSATTAAGTVTTNEATGTLYFLRNNSATATDVAVKAGLSQAVTAAGIQTVNVTGLTASTPGNYIHYLHRDGSGNDSLVSSSAAFATPAEPPPGVVSDEVGFRSFMRYPMGSAIKGALA